MIATGAGIAPFIGFLQEREYQMQHASKFVFLHSLVSSLF
jgi:sulfite reductase alpha subunit-like flavoprotein